MMNIFVTLHGNLADDVTYFNPKKGFKVALKENSKVYDLIEELSIPIGKIGAAYMNGTKIGFDDVLENAAKVELFQPILGG